MNGTECCIRELSLSLGARIFAWETAAIGVVITIASTMITIMIIVGATTCY